MTDETWIWWMERGQKLGCHQMPERSFFIGGYQFPVCARCTGVLISAVLGTICFWIDRLPIWLCVALSSIMLIDWLIQYFGIKQSTNLRRLITGIVGGFGYTQIHWYIYSYIFHILKLLLKTIGKCF